MAKAAQLNIDIVAHAAQALGMLRSVKDTASSGWSTMKVAATAAAGAVIAELGVATHAAMEHEVAVSKLRTAYRDAGVPASKMAGDLEEIDAAARRTGQSSEDLTAAYTKLIVATKDTSKAHQLLAVAQDLAAYKGISVEAATNAVIKANQGNTKALAAMGIATKDAAGHALSSTAVMKNLTAAVKGQAVAYGDTATGKIARYHESLHQIQVAIGTAVLPALNAMISALMPLFTWLSKNQGITRVLVPAVGTLAAAVIGITAAMRVWAVVQAALNLVMSANPIGAVIVAIAALVAGVILAYKHFKPFRDIVNDLWHALMWFGNWVMGHWRLILGVMLGPIAALILNFGQVKQLVEDVIHAIESLAGKVKDALGWLGKIPGAGIISKIIPHGTGAAAPAGAGAAAPVTIYVYATPGDDLPQVVYDAMRRYQRQHQRPELRPAFGR